jgi:hypothetical protein
MQIKSWVMLRVLLNKYHQKASDTLLKILPEEDANGIKSQTTYSNNAEVVLTQPEELIRKIHYSWLTEAFKVIPKAIQEPILSVLPQSDAVKLRHILKLPSPHQVNKVSVPVKTFLINTLYNHVKDHAVLPLQYLPTTELSPLTNLTKDQLVDLIDLLGIYDLAEGVRNIIDKERIKKIYKHLSPMQIQFLKSCLQQKERISATPLKLEQWDGDWSKLEKILHGRGLIRLGKAISGQHPDFVWHLTHILDVGRGARLLVNYSPTATPQITPVLAQQVLNLMNTITPKRAP